MYLFQWLLDFFTAAREEREGNFPFMKNTQIGNLRIIKRIIIFFPVLREKVEAR